jgi:hypothetical protein
MGVLVHSFLLTWSSNLSLIGSNANTSWFTWMGFYKLQNPVRLNRLHHYGEPPSLLGWTSVITMMDH